jgi:hypothetical protein
VVKSKDQNNFNITVSGGFGAFDILLTASDGSRTGSEPVTGKSIYEIPESGFYTDSLANATTGESPTSMASTIHIERPAAGIYTLDIRSQNPNNVVYIDINQFTRVRLDKITAVDTPTVSVLHVKDGLAGQQVITTNPASVLNSASYTNSFEVNTWNKYAPFNVLLVDPQNRKSGMDPTTNTYIQEIPNSSTLTIANNKLPTGIKIQQPQPGLYTFAVRASDPWNLPITADRKDRTVLSKVPISNGSVRLTIKIQDAADTQWIEDTSTLGPNKEFETQAQTVMNALKAKDFSTLANFVHPTLGVSFHAWAIPDRTSASAFQASQVQNFPISGPFVIGKNPASGKSVSFDPKSEGFSRFIVEGTVRYSPSDAIEHSADEPGFIMRGVQEVFPGAKIVEFESAGTEKNAFLDWRKVFHIYQKHTDGKWHLVALTEYYSIP